MARIPIVNNARKALIPKSKDLSSTVDRFHAPGGKPPLPLQKSYNKQGKA